MKFLLFVALAFVAIWLFRTQRRHLKGSDASAPRSAPPHAPTADALQEMVRCAHCGVHVPRQEAIVGRMDFYCSAEHRDIAQA